MTRVAYIMLVAAAFLNSACATKMTNPEVRDSVSASPIPELQIPSSEAPLLETPPVEPRDLTVEDKLQAFADCPVSENAVLEEANHYTAMWKFYRVDGKLSGPVFSENESSFGGKISAVGCFKENGKSYWKQIDSSGEAELELSVDGVQTVLIFIQAPEQFQSLLPLPINETHFYRNVEGKRQLGFPNTGRFRVYCAKPEVCGEIVGEIEDRQFWSGWGRANPYEDSLINLRPPVRFDITDEGKAELERKVYEVQGNWCLTETGWIYGENCMTPPESIYAYKEERTNGLGLGVTDRTLYDSPEGEEAAISKKWKENASDGAESPFELMGIVERKEVDGTDWIKVRLKARSVEDDDPEAALLEEVRQEVVGKEFWIRLYGESELHFNFYKLPWMC